MGRGPNRKKVLVEKKIDRNRSVFVKVWLDTQTVDISVPDRKITGFYLRHIKGLSIADAKGILSCLAILEDDGELNGRP